MTITQWSKSRNKQQCRKITKIKLLHQWEWPKKEWSQKETDGRLRTSRLKAVARAKATTFTADGMRQDQQWKTVFQLCQLVPHYNWGPKYCL